MLSSTVHSEGRDIKGTDVKKKKKDIALPTKQHKTSRLPAVTQFMCNKFTHAFNGFEIKEVHMEERMGVELLVKFEARGFWRSFKSNLKAPQPKKKKKKNESSKGEENCPH